jgi:hypothetical protein
MVQELLRVQKIVLGELVCDCVLTTSALVTPAAEGGNGQVLLLIAVILCIHVLLVHVDGLSQGHWISHGGWPRGLVAQQVVDHGLRPISL